MSASLPGVGADAASSKTTRRTVTRSARVTVAKATTARPAVPPSPGRSTASVPATSDTARRALDWSRCAEWGDSQCAQLAVPLDPADPNGRTIEVALLRVPARSSSNRLGVLLVNPGGPGVSGRAFARQLARGSLSASVASRYDIIGFDPRGVGGSTQVRCFDSSQWDRYYAADQAPRTPRGIEVLAALNRELSQACADKAGDLLAHVSTDDVVRDMDRIRVALGEDRISYFGFSYGTFLGARYADRYPDRVRAMVLDGALDPTADTEERIRKQAGGFEASLRDFLDQCRKADCGFVAKGQDPVDGFDQLMARVAGDPLTVGSGKASRTLGLGEMQTAVLAGLYNRSSGWNALRSALDKVMKGDGAPMLALFDSYADRNPDGTYKNTTDANSAVNCSDVPASRNIADYVALADDLERSAPHFGRFAAFASLVCATWPVPGPSVLRPTRAKGAPAIVVIGTTKDPATPFAWAQSLARQLESGVLLTYDGEGHTAYLGGSTCIRSAVDGYLLSGQPPADGKVC